MYDYKLYEDRAEHCKQEALSIVAHARSEGNRPLTDGEEENYHRLEGQMEAFRAMAQDAKDAKIKALEDDIGLTIETVARTTPTDVFRAMERGTEMVLPRGAFPTTGCTSGACYMVGQEWHDTIEKLRYEGNFMRSQGARVIRTESTHNIPILSSLGSAGWAGELAAYTSCDPILSPVILYAYKLTRKTQVSEELLADQMYDVAGYLAESTGMAFAQIEENAFMVGCGTACIQPAGVFSCSSSCQTVACVACVTTQELITHAYKLSRPYRDGAVWMMSDASVLKIALLGVPMKDATATCTTNVALPYFWTDAIGGEPPKLMGFPVFTNSCIPVMATGSGVIVLGNPKFYVIGERGPLSVQRLKLDEYSDTFAFSQRIDGKMMTTDAFKLLLMG